MNRFLPGTFFALALLLASPFARANSVLPLSLDDHIRVSDAVFRGTVIEVVSYRDPADDMIYTRTSLRVDEALKGKLPPVIKLVHFGGTLESIGEMNDLSPQFKVGEERLLFVTRRGDGTLFATQGSSSAPRLRRDNRGAFAPAPQNLLNAVRIRTDFGKIPGADVTDQAANVSPNSSIFAPSGDTSGPSTNGLLVDANNVPWRYPKPDRGEPIPYLVDAASLPPGITLPQALDAVSNALSAWAAVSSFRFTFAGTNSFGVAARNISTNDGIFRIQLHDNYNFITNVNVLGVGGSYYVPGLLTNAGWGKGGNVAGTEFNKGACGYIILKHTNVVMQTPSTFTEVLCHEVGHVIGLAHSSEDPSETNAVLKDAIMYFTVHADGRGARLGAYDPPVVREVHPLNTPPYSYDRFMDVTTAASTPNVPGINEIEMRGYDLQTTNLGLSVAGLTANDGTFTNVGSLIKYTPHNNVSSSRNDPADGPNGSFGFIDLLYARHSDGTNASPYVRVRVLSLNYDSYSFPIFPPPSDGIPDNWMTNFFGHGDPRAADNSRATDDADGDTMNNLNEYRAGMNPTNSSSGQRVTLLGTNAIQWQAKAYELYEVLSSTDLFNWSRVGNPVQPTNAPIQIRTNLLDTSFIATVSNLPPANAQIFYRVLKVP